MACKCVPGGRLRPQSGRELLPLLDMPATARGYAKGRTSRETVELGLTAPAAAATGPPGAGASAAAAAKKTPLTAQQLAAPAVVTLTETESIILLEMPGLVVAGDSVEGSAVAAANSRYKALVQSREASADRYSCGEAQTLPVLCKHREVQSGCSTMVSQESQASNWDMYDCYSAMGQNREEAEEEVLLGSVLPGGQAVATGT